MGLSWKILHLQAAIRLEPLRKKLKDWSNVNSSHVEDPFSFSRETLLSPFSTRGEAKEATVSLPVSDSKPGGSLLRPPPQQRKDRGAPGFRSGLVVHYIRIGLWFGGASPWCMRRVAELPDVSSRRPSATLGFVQQMKQLPGDAHFLI